MPRPLPQALLPAGIGFHNAAMESEDRALVEGLFREGSILVLVGRGAAGAGRAHHQAVGQVPAQIIQGAAFLRVLGGYACSGA